MRYSSSREIADILFAMKGEDQYAAGVVLVYSPTSIHYLHNGSDRGLFGEPSQ